MQSYNSSEKNYQDLESSSDKSSFEEVDIFSCRIVKNISKELDRSKKSISNISEYNKVYAEGSIDINRGIEEDNDLGIKALGNNRCSIMTIFNKSKDEVLVSYIAKGKNRKINEPQ